jgi:superfamily I DNA/RNA helicase
MSNTWWKDPEELKKEQADLLDLPVENSLLIKGPPGSGKTNLLLLRANQLHLGDYPNLHIVVFGSLLKRFIQLGGHQYNFPNSKVITHTQLFNEILKAEGQYFNAEGMTLSEARSERASRIESLLKAGKIGAQFEALLIDEAQDYTETEIHILRKICRVLVGTADSRQAIYEVKGDPVGILEKLVTNVYPLKYHFRNGLEICRLADGINKDKQDYVQMQPYSNYDEAKYPSTVSQKPGLTLEQQASAIAIQLELQRFSYPDDLLGVLCPTNDALDSICTSLNDFGLGEEITRANSPDFDPTRRIWVSTLTAAKGLEFRAVHIAGLDQLHLMGAVQKRLIFTGITRAKTALTLYWERSIPGYLESALLNLAPARPTVTRKQIFGGGS